MYAVARIKGFVYATLGLVLGHVSQIDGVGDHGMVSRPSQMARINTDNQIGTVEDSRSESGEVRARIRMSRLPSFVTCDSRPRRLLHLMGPWRSNEEVP